MYSITKQFRFEAAHQLLFLPAEHQCSRLHGHSYRVEVVLESETLDAKGFVVDYAELDIFAAYLKNRFDHRFLNDVIGSMDGRATTAERMAEHLFLVLSEMGFDARLKAVRVMETAKTVAEYSR